MIHKVALGAPMAALILVLSVKRAIGFHPAVAAPPTQTVDTRLAMTKKTKKAKKSIVPSVDSNPFREVKIDVNKAKDAADHFGRYSVKEIERMRDGEKEKDNLDQREFYVSRPLQAHHIFDFFRYIPLHGQTFMLIAFRAWSLATRSHPPRSFKNDFSKTSSVCSFTCFGQKRPIRTSFRRLPRVPTQN